MREEARSSTEREIGRAQISDDATMARAMQVRRIMNESLRNRTPQERDRIMQVHLAQARGASANAALVRSAMNLAIRLRRARGAMDGHDDR